ncbi:MAG: histidinol-phosphatase [Planctomycetota bacterium]
MATLIEMPISEGVDREIARRLELAIAAAQAAGGVTLQFFQTDRLGTQTKGDGSPVTEADRGAEQTLRAAIEESFPDDAILGEEFGDKAGSSGYRWILDPIDGTISFVHGVPLYGTLVGVLRGDEPIAGVVHMPALGETVYAARGGGAWWVPRPGQDARPAAVTATSTLAEATLVTTALEYFTQMDADGAFLDITRACARTRGWSDCYAHVLLATGRCDAVVEPTIKPWDVAPLPVILVELGGGFSDWTGEPRIDGGHAIATNGRLHAELLDLVRPHA